MDREAIYFIRVGSTPPIKIGHALSVVTQVRKLQEGNPDRLRVLGVHAGGFDVKAKLHRRFRIAHLHGEWFTPIPDLLAYIEAKTEPLDVYYRRTLKGQGKWEAFMAQYYELFAPWPDEATDQPAHGSTTSTADSGSVGPPQSASASAAATDVSTKHAPHDPQEFLPVAQVATLLNISESSARAMIRKHLLEGVKVGRRLFVPRAALTAMMAEAMGDQLLAHRAGGQQEPSSILTFLDQMRADPEVREILNDATHLARKVAQWVVKQTEPPSSPWPLRHRSPYRDE